MLYYLFEYLQKCDFPGAGMFTYVTFRAIFAIITSLVISIWFGEYFIKLLKRRQISETQRDESIDPFNTQKKGVPTMGGIIIMLGIIATTIGAFVFYKSNFLLCYKKISDLNFLPG